MTRPADLTPSAADSLERAYRRLLAFYPMRHRRLHGEEMLGVLLETTPPDRDRPGPAATFDLLAGAVKVRLIGPGGVFAGDAWRRAALLLGPAIALFMVARAAPLFYLVAHEGPLIMHDYRVESSVQAALCAAWALVLLPLAFGRRRIAAVVAALLSVAHLASLILTYSGDAGTAETLIPLLVLTVVGTLSMLVHRPVRRLGSKPAFAVAGGVLVAGVLWRGIPVMNVLTGHGLPERVGWALEITLGTVAIGAVLVVLRRIGVATLVRVAALLVPVLASRLLYGFGVSGWYFTQGQFVRTIYLSPAQWAMNVVVPVLAFALAVCVVAGGEYLLRILRSDLATAGEDRSARDGAGAAGERA